MVDATDWKARGLRLEILTGPIKASSGLADHVQYVTLVGPNLPRICRRDTPSEDAPAVVLGESAPGHPVLRPLDEHGRAVRCQASGAYAVGRWGWFEATEQKLPYPLHDRSEGRQYRPWTGAEGQPVPEPVLTRLFRETDV